MDKDKLLSMAKTMKWVPVVMGLLCLLIGAISLFVKTEDAEAKRNIMLFALMGVMGLAIMVFGMANSSLFEALASLEEKNAASSEDDLDILP